MKRTRIVATIGPASATPGVLLQIIKSGVNIARLNFSHGTFPEHAKYISAVRLAARRAKKQVGILQDLSGPKVRVGTLPPEGVQLVEGEKILLSNNPKSKNAIPYQYLGLSKDVSRGDIILFDDGLLEVEVISNTTTEIVARVLTGGTLFSNKGINLPNSRLQIPAITAKDKKDLVFGLGHGVDFVALSFVRDPRDIEQLRKLIAAEKPRRIPKIIAKIEKHEAIENLEKIIHAADGIMIARGDLGVEIPPEQVPLIQKRIIQLCIEAQKPVIVATQMMDSMIRNPRPTRAEVSDVAWAVLEGADAVMLSGESANGKYPVETVSMMNRIIMTVEEVENEKEIHPDAIIVPHTMIHMLPSIVSVRSVSVILVQTKTEAESGSLMAYYGVYPFRIRALSKSHLNRAILRAAEDADLVTKKSKVVAVEATKKDPFFVLKEIR